MFLAHYGIVGDSYNYVHHKLTSCKMVTYFFHHKYFCTLGPSPDKK